MNSPKEYYVQDDVKKLIALNLFLEQTDLIKYNLTAIKFKEKKYHQCK
jgi:hypothetical protein